MSQTLLPPSSGSEGAEEPEDADRAGRPEQAGPATRPHAALDAAPEAGEVAAQPIASPTADPPHHAQWPEQQPWPQAQWPQAAGGPWPQAQWSQAQPWPQSAPHQPQWPQPMPYPIAYPAAYPAGYPASYPASYPAGYPAAQQPLMAAQAAVVTAEPPVVIADVPTPDAPTPEATAPKAPKAPKAPPAAAPIWEMARPKQPFAWRAMKWPIRTALKGVYLTGSAAKRHRAAAAVLLVLLLAALGSTIVIYQLTHPTTTPGEMAGQQSGAPAQDQTPFTYAIMLSPSPSRGVTQWLQAYKAYDGKQVWNSMSPEMQSAYSQQGLGLDWWRNHLAEKQQSGITYQQFIYTGGGALPGGYTHFTFDVVLVSQDNHQEVNTWYFVTDSNQKVVQFTDLSPRGSHGS